jgi:hypothetical protein
MKVGVISLGVQNWSSFHLKIARRKILIEQSVLMAKNLTVFL